MSRWLVSNLLSIAACLGCIAIGSRFAGAQVATANPLSFNRDIRPILTDKCFACHGQDAKKREADLRLDTLEGATADRDGIPAIVPGDLEGSELWRRVTSEDPDEAMPPESSNKTLTDAEKSLLRQWIEQGAPYQKHWAFETLRWPIEPNLAGEPQVIDTFLAKRMQHAGLTAQPLADRPTLVRRVALALTGLPPTIEEIDKFLTDDAPGAYERMVDRYLASPRFGEEMARGWLDVARYADTHGLHLDNERQMWAYRDWVVKAFNENLPFDQFTVWQVAGDLLPNPTTDQLIASGFNRCNVTTSEGGAIDAEFTYRYAVERTTTVAQAWLGLTAGCAICHDHKYDPLTMKEFYSLYAFFNSAADPAMDGNINTTMPFLKLPTPEQRASGESAAHVQQQTQQWLISLSALARYQDPADLPEAAAAKPVVDVLFDDALPLGATSRCSSRNATVWIVDPPYQAASGRRVIQQAFAADYNDTIEFKLQPLVVPHDGRLEMLVRVEPLDVPQTVSLTFAGHRKSVTWSRVEGGLVRDGSTDVSIVPGQWTKLSVPLADWGLQPGQRIGGVTLAQRGGIVQWDDMRLVGLSSPSTDPLESFSAWRKALDRKVPPELPDDLQPLITEGADKVLSAEEASRLRNFYLAMVARPSTPELASARSIWESARVARLVADQSAAGTLIFRDLDTPRDSFVMLRGQYDKPGEKVEPGVPAALPQVASQPGARLTRLDLARWLVSTDNPLTARVTANRLWQQYFGTGLVKTSYDFGTRGEPPTHPELLDWLACNLRESGWDVKRFVKLLLMSEAFQRDSRVTPEIQAVDPANRLYARGPRFRLDAEQVRDNALFVSGLLNLDMGGPGVRPYQPPNIWEPVGYSDSNTRFYLQDHGPALYRRSLYVFLKRTAPPPFMSNFDGPNREQVCAVRERSNTPLQALQLMNDVQHFEAARALAERILAEADSSPEDRITYLYRTVLSRSPSPQEQSIVLAALARQRELYQSAPEQAQKAVHVGEFPPRNVAPVEETAAWTMIANLILNTDETLNRN
jgi:hypothetical protein